MIGSELVVLYLLIGYDSRHPNGEVMAEFDTLVECTSMMQRKEIRDIAIAGNIRLECKRK